jgi:4a-hydroxytetrahydrobiopterin dehydratase
MSSQGPPPGIDGQPPLAERRCVPCEGNTPPLEETRIALYLRELPGWIVEAGRLVKVFPFRNYYRTMAFVNAVAWVAHREDHHPELRVAYNQCRVEFWTHAIDGLSENDFICAARCDSLATS